MSTVFRLTKIFYEASVAAMNWEKSFGFFYGEWNVVPDVFVGIRWGREPFQYLGVPLQHHVWSDSYWTSVVANTRRMSMLRGKSNLSFCARATVCNKFLVAKLCYVLEMLHFGRLNIQTFHQVFALYL